MVFISLLCLFFLAFPGGNQGHAEDSSMENYRYNAVPTGRENGKKEYVEMEIVRSGEDLRYRTKSISAAGSEEIEIETDRVGHVSSASRRYFPARKETVTLETIRRQDGKAYLKKGMEPEEAARSFDLPTKKYFAVDGSLLILLRNFPFEGGETWPIYMVDFSGASVTVTLRQTGLESVVVPAGTFDCYKMEVTVEIPLLKPHITYWVTIKSPHFLVKSLGRRGPFTPHYETVLLAVK